MQHDAADREPFDPDAWEGDLEELIGHEDLLANSSEDLCDKVFASKREAFSTGLFLASQPTFGLDADPGSPFDQQARRESLAAIEHVPWGNIINAVDSMNESLRRAMEATTDAFWMWETGDAGERRFGDEFSLTSHEVDNLTPEWRIAYVARLIRSLEVCWGVSTEFGGGALGAPSEDRSYPGWLIRALVAILYRSLARHRRGSSQRRSP
jgi:hypothetical protein